MRTATVYVFPNLREPIIAVVRYWNKRGYWLSNDKRGRLMLTKSRGNNHEFISKG